MSSDPDKMSLGSSGIGSSISRPSSSGREEMACEMRVPDVYQMHPLYCTWGVWIHMDIPGLTWIESHRLFAKFSYLEEFWRLYLKTTKVTKLPTGRNYAVFKEHILPMWEDEKNEHGGRWILEIPLKDKEWHLENIWMCLLVLVIKNTFNGFGKDICGLVLNVKKSKQRFSLWTADASNEESVKAIGKVLTQELEAMYPKVTIIQYFSHKKSAAMCKDGFVPKDPSEEVD